MGVQDAVLAAITGRMDWSQTEGTIDHIEELVNDLPEVLEIHGNGLVVERHFHDKKGELKELVQEARSKVDKARQICYKVLERL